MYFYAILISTRGLSSDSFNTLNTRSLDFVINSIPYMMMLRSLRDHKVWLIKTYVFMTCYVSLLKWLRRLLYWFDRKILLSWLIATSERYLL